MTKAECFKATAHPSLALAKYWGKRDLRLNTPATASLGISLDAFYCTVSLSALEGSNVQNSREDRCLQEGRTIFVSEQLRSMLAGLRKSYALPPLIIDSASNIPVAAGLAGSSAYFAALAAAIALFLQKKQGMKFSEQDISAIARQGSASAARSVFPGFQWLAQGAMSAESVFSTSHWQNLRIICVIVEDVQKSISSRAAMNRCAETSPLYDAWCTFANTSARDIREVVKQRDLESLGKLITQNAYAMMGSMLASNPSIRYWVPHSLAVLDEVARLRNKGISVWETMDAGPQIKLLCDVQDVALIVQHLQKSFPNMRIEQSSIGGGASAWSE